MTTPYPGNSNWPSDWQPAFIKGQFIDATGRPYSGAQCSLVCSVSRVATVTSKVTVLSGSDITVYLDVNGRIYDGAGNLSLAIPASGDPDVTPNNFTYTFTDPAGNQYLIAPAVNQTIDIANLTPSVGPGSGQGTVPGGQSLTVAAIVATGIAATDIGGITAGSVDQKIAAAGQGYDPAGAAAQRAPGLQLTQAQKTTTPATGPVYVAGTAPAFAPVNVPDVTAITVDPYDQFQEILGFGAAITDSSAFLMMNSLTQAQRTAVLQKLYSPTQGNLSTARICVGSSDFRNDPAYYTYDDTVNNVADPTLAGFSLGNDLRYIVPLLQEIRAINPGIRFIASMWSPPAWMKTVQSGASSVDIAQGGFNTTYLTQLANYWVAYIQAMQAYGLPIYAVTGQNECSATYAGRPSMIFTNAQALAFYQPLLRPALDAAGLSNVRIWPNDSSWYPALNDFSGVGIVPPYLADSATMQAIDGFSYHGYSGDPYTGAGFLRRLGKSWHMTEYRTLLSQSWTSSIRDMLGVHFIDSMRAGAASVTLWNLALDPTGLPTQGSTGRRGVITVATDGTGVVYNTDGTFAGAPDAYSLLHFAPFLRPGARRIQSTHNAAGLKTVAFLNRDGEIVLVVYNAASTAITTTVGDARTNTAFVDTFQPGDVVTYRWGTITTSTPTAAAVVPTAPTVPAISAVAGNLMVNLTITPGAAGSTPTRYYRYYRSTNGGAFNLLTVQLSPTYTDTNVVAGTPYAYKAIAVGSAWSSLSPASSAVIPTAASVPGVATNVTATAIGSGANVSWLAASANGSPVTSYAVYRSSGGAYTAVGTTPDGTTTTYKDTTTVAGTTYTYEVVATNAVGAGGFSAASNSITAFTAATLDSHTDFASNAQTATYSFTVTPQATSTLAVLEIGYATFDQNGGSISGVTWGGTAMTLVSSFKPGTAQPGGDRCVDVWKFYNGGTALGTTPVTVTVTFARGGTQTHTPNVGMSALLFSGVSGAITNVLTASGASGVTQLQTSTPAVTTKDLLISVGSFRNSAAPTISESNATLTVSQVPVAGSNEWNRVSVQPGLATAQTSTWTGITSTTYTQALTSFVVTGQ